MPNDRITPASLFPHKPTRRGMVYDTVVRADKLAIAVSNGYPYEEHYVELGKSLTAVALCGGLVKFERALQLSKEVLFNRGDGTSQGAQLIVMIECTLRRQPFYLKMLEKRSK